MGTSPRVAGAVACLIPLVLAVIGGPVCYVALVLYAFGSAYWVLIHDTKLRPWLLYCVALALLWSTTLLGAGVVGTDIHAEYRLARAAWLGSWDYTNIHIYSTSLLSVPFTALVSKLLHLDPVWLYKIAIPALAASTAPVLFILYRQYVGEKQAYLAALLVVLSPTFLVELLGMARQMTALPFMVAAVALLADKHSWAWSSWRRALVVLACGMLAATSHYTTGMILLFIIGCAIAFGIGARLLRRGDMPLVKPVAVCGAIVTLSLLYYTVVGQGIVLYTLGAKIGPFIDPLLSHAGVNITELAPKPAESATITPPSVPSGNGNDAPATAEPDAKSLLDRLEGHERAMKLALGYGMRDGDRLVRQWWEFQYASQILVVLGAAWSLWQWWKGRKWSTQYMAVAAATMVIGALCVFMPSFSALLNATRFWLIILLFEAPLVVALLADVMRRETTVLFTLIPYFLFTSGIVFEVAQYDVSVVRIPYSIALSNDRLDLGASTTQDDIAVRQYIMDNKLYPVYTDWFGAMFLTECIPEDDVYWGWPQPPAVVTSTATPDDYVFMRSRNTSDGVWVEWSGIGTREMETVEEQDFGVRTVLYQSGSAAVLDCVPRNPHEGY